MKAFLLLITLLQISVFSFAQKNEKKHQLVEQNVSNKKSNLTEQQFFQVNQILNTKEFKDFCNGLASSSFNDYNQWNKQFKTNEWKKLKHEVLSKVNSNTINKNEIFEITKNIFLSSSTFTQKTNQNLLNQLIIPVCNNAGFENGNFDGWVGTAGTNNGVANSGTDFSFSVTANNDFSLCKIVTNGFDSIIPNLKKVPDNGGNYACLLNHLPAPSGSAGRISKTFVVDPTVSSFIVKYAMVLEDPFTGHALEEMPYFSIRTFKSNGDTLNQYFLGIKADSTDSNFYSYSQGNLKYLVRDWSAYILPLSNLIGDTITVEITAADCSQTGHSGWAYIDAACGYAGIFSERDSLCNNNSIDLIAPYVNGSYQWSGPNGFNASTATVTVSDSGTYSVYIIPTGDTASAFTLTKYIGEYTRDVWANFAGGPVCLGSAMAMYDSSTTTNVITSWEWDFNADSTYDSNDQNPVYTFSNYGTFPVKLKVKTNNCEADTIINVDVFESPVFSLADTTALCEGDSITFNISISGTNNYTWSTGSNLSSETFSDAGVYWVIVNNNFNCSNMELITILSNPDPSADFTYQDSVNTITFTNTSLNANTYSWAISDTLGNVSTYYDENPVHLVNQDGIYAVCLIAENDCSADTICKTINITSTGINRKDLKKGMELYPIPANGSVTLNFKEETTVNSIEIFNNTGQMVWRTELNQVKMDKYSISNLCLVKGIYILKVKGENADDIYTKKLIIE